MATSIGVLAEDRYLTQAQPHGLMAALSARGVRVTLLGPDGPHDRHDDRQSDGHDLVVVRGRSEELLQRLSQLEHDGVPTMNRRHAIDRVVDKAEMHLHLQAAGVPLPDTWAGPFDELRAQLEHQPRALVVKPVRGDNGRDVVLLTSGRCLRSLWWSEHDAIVQRYLPNDGCDIKLYGIGDLVWTVRKTSPLHRVDIEPCLLPTTDEHREIARRCRLATGLDLYGVDCVATDDGLVVIEVNDFPNYSGIPGADDALACHVVGAAEHTMAGVA